jgi:hypothetical protein
VKYVKGFFMLLDYVYAAENPLLVNKLTPAQVILAQAKHAVKMESLAAEHVEAAMQDIGRLTTVVESLQAEVAELRANSIAVAAPLEMKHVVVRTGHQDKPVKVTKIDYAGYLTINEYMSKNRYRAKQFPPSALGRLTSKNFRETFAGEEPPKLRGTEVQLDNGRMVRPNSYPLGILERSFKEYAQKRK